MSLSITQMPEFAMDIILNQLDYVSTQRLRKVCRHIRRFIDFNYTPKQKTPPENIWITVGTHSITLKFHVAEREESIVYGEQDIGCSVDFYDEDIKKFGSMRKLNLIILKNEKHVDIFFKDFECFLKHHKRRFGTLAVKFDRGEHGISKFFETFKTLKLDAFHLNMNNPNQVFGIEQLTEMDFWRNAKELKLMNCHISDPIQSFLHFQKLYVIYKTINPADILYLKKEFVQNPQLDYYQIGFFIKMSENELVQLLGNYLTLGGFRFYRRRWFFRTKNPEKVLEICSNRNCFEFQCFELTTVPKNAVIQD